MKAYVYDKKTSKKIAEIKNVMNVADFKPLNKIIIVDGNNSIFEYDTKNVKTCIYQN